jgi:hypothetical protein
VLRLNDAGTWTVGWRPTSCKIIFTNEAGGSYGPMASVKISDGAGEVNVYGSVSNYVSGQEIPLTCTGDIGHFNMLGTYAAGFFVTSIQFYGPM